ncbi:MAG TPA: threonine/serine exporter family protein [Gemmatimonadales bacterium]|nr:threonine/serine exporter family protein [Gemmatimonadales bacterium]
MGDAPLHPHAIEFILRMGRALHRHGFSAYRLEGVMTRLAAKLGIDDAQVFSTPTSIMAAFGPLGAQQTHLMRVEPGSVNLGQLTQLDRVATQVLNGELSAADGIARLREIEARSAPYAPLLELLAYTLISAAVARFLGGGVREIAVAAALGFVIGLLSWYGTSRPWVGRVFEPLAAFFASLAAGVIAARWLPHAVFLSTLAGLVVLLPGFSLTIGVRELSTQHLASGTARLSAALVTFLGIGFGVALGTRIAGNLAAAVPAPAVEPLPGWTLWVAILLAGLSFTVIMRAEPRDALWVVLAGAIAVLAGRLGASLLGLELGAFVGSLAVGIAGNTFTRLRNRPSSIMLVPGVTMLVPGTVGFRSLSALLEAEVVTGVETAFRMALTAIALVAGLLFADIVTPNRRIV